MKSSATCSKACPYVSSQHVARQFSLPLSNTHSTSSPHHFCLLTFNQENIFFSLTLWDKIHVGSLLYLLTQFSAQRQLVNNQPMKSCHLHAYTKAGNTTTTLNERKQMNKVKRTPKQVALKMMHISSPTPCFSLALPPVWRADYFRDWFGCSGRQGWLGDLGQRKIVEWQWCF